MNTYAIFFDYDNKTYRLPTNPEEIQTTSSMSVNKFEVLKLGQVAVPTHLELEKYSFECEFPHKITSYAETLKYFHNAEYYINLFKKWREDLIPVRFIATNNEVDINTLVLIEGLTIKEKAGEEGDKYISFDLLEYQPFRKYKSIDLKKGTVTQKKEDKNVKSTKAKKSHVVVSGDTLWAISKKYYGNGAKYTKIYDANKDKIKNPGLIYPGQKLVIP